MNAHARHVQNRFDGEAETWNGHYQCPDARSIYAHNLLRRQQCAQTLIGPASGRLLELGCGAGNVLLSAAEHTGLRPFGADFSTGMLARAKHNARDKHRTLPLLAADVRHLPFASDSFDAILCLGVLEYIPEYGRVIAESARILKPGGQFIASIPNGTSPFIRIDDFAFGLKNAVTRGLLPAGLRTFVKTRFLGRPDKPYFNHKKQRFCPAHFSRELQKAGFRIHAHCYQPYGFGLLEGNRFNVRLSEYLEQRTENNPQLEKLGWTYLLKAVKP